MVIFAVALHEGRLKVGTDRSKECAQCVMRTFRQHLPAILCDERQMDM